MKMLFMKLMICMLLAAPITVWAQKTDSFRNSVGLFYETNWLFRNAISSPMETAGFQYVRKGKKWLNYNISVGYGNYESTPERYWVRNVHVDTFRSVSRNKKFDLAILGLGIEAERQFYKKLCFFAGLGLRLGYGRGPTDSVFEKRYLFREYNPFIEDTVVSGNWEIRHSAGPDESMFYAGLTPYFGLKVDFKRFSVGTSFMNYIALTIMPMSGGGTDRVIEFIENNITQQFFVRYKF